MWCLVKAKEKFGSAKTDLKRAVEGNGLSLDDGNGFGKGNRAPDAKDDGEELPSTAAKADGKRVAGGAEVLPAGLGGFGEAAGLLLAKDTMGSLGHGVEGDLLEDVRETGAEGPHTPEDTSPLKKSKSGGQGVSPEGLEGITRRLDTEDLSEDEGVGDRMRNMGEEEGMEEGLPAGISFPRRWCRGFGSGFSGFWGP